MSLSLAIAVNLILAVGLLAGLAYAMSRAARLTPHHPLSRSERRRPALHALRGEAQPAAQRRTSAPDEARAA